ncbi:MAG: hypothetical protein ACOYY2_11015 [Actinomycetota bacterium]
MRKRIIAAGGLAALLLGGVGVTSAFAATSPTPTTPPVVQSGPQSTVPEPGEVGGAESTETAPGVEANSAESAVDASLPGGGHADPDGQNVDNQFNGVQ